MPEKEQTDYSATVHLPRTDFPMKAGLAEREPLQLKAWEEAGSHRGLRERRRGAPKWVLHDGPPFANGSIHMGHALNHALKDFCVRYKSMRGFDAPYVPGWDCHGMPIEYKVSREWPKGQEKTPAAVRERCRREAEKWIGLQKEQVRRLGLWGDWEHPYRTMDPAFEAAQLDAYFKLYQSGQIYRGLKPVHWCARDQTALAEAELEYAPHHSHAVFVKFALGDAAALEIGRDLPVFALIWTTTPWTLPANLGIAVNANFDYAAYAVDGEAWILAEGLAPAFFAKLNRVGLPAALWRGKGSRLEGLKARHPFLERDSPLLLAPYVTLDAGTGLVHTAPGHGADDYATGARYGLPVLAPVDAQGRFTAEAGLPSLTGKSVLEDATNLEVVEILKGRGALAHHEKFEHSYPHCWRCKQPILFRATEQWFMSLERNGLRDKAMEEIGKVRWLNPWGAERLGNMVKDRADWCISRQRAWGVPIYMYYCKACRHPHFSAESHRALRRAVEAEGSGVWLERAMDFLEKGAACEKCGGRDFEPEQDTLDGWFDSGSTHLAVLKAREDLAWPADLYLEGSDQYRGWFQSSLLVAVGTEGAAPYRAVLSHGWVLDEKGRAMHKSAGNVVDPQDVVSRYGADIVRLWAASENFTEDLGLGEDILRRVADSYRRLRNSFRWLLGNLDGFDPGARPPEPEKLFPLDRWLLGRLDRLVETCTAHMEAFEFHRFTAAYVQFCAVELSSLVFDVHKDTLYTLSRRDPRRLSALTALYQVLQTLVRLGAPVLAFTCEEVWSAMPQAWKEVPSVHQALWPEPGSRWRDPELEEDFGLLLDVVRPVVTKKLEEARAAKAVGHPYDAEVELSVHSKRLTRLLAKYEKELPGLFVVSKVELKPAAPQDGVALSPDEVAVKKSGQAKCGRCWRRPGDVGSRQEHPALCGRCADALKEGA